ncbi:MAG: membrane protein insertion efficiency factor YidD, partial [Chloroflexota bacterium]|nr:membrane protein insertion efficiency factor YidD [Chloroflexota bacterium]
MTISLANNWLKYSLGYILDLYKMCVSPYINSQCFYAETCSSYSKRIILEKGVIIGSYLTFFRLISCTFKPVSFDLKKIRKNKVFLLTFPVISILFVSCMSFSYEGGWSNIVYSKSDDSYLVTTSKGKLHKFRLSDGVPVVDWTYPKESKNTSYSDPLIFQNSVISSNFSCRGNSCEGEIFQLNLLNGELQWEINTNTKISPKIAINDNILVYATLKKQTEVSNNKEAEIHFLELSENSYDFLGKITLEGEIWTGIYLFNEKFVVSTLDGWVYILDPYINSSEEITLENIMIDSRKFPYSINSPISYSN